MKVSSFNVRCDNKNDVKNGNAWANRRQVVASMILFHDLDIVGTQECKNNQVMDLDSLLQTYSYIGRGRGKKPIKGEYSAIFYKTDKYNLLNHGDFWLSKKPHKPSKSWDAAVNRICTWGEFEEKSTGFRFFVFNLHMDHVGEKARRESAILVLEKIEEFAGNDTPTMLLGDFNFTPANEVYQTFVDSEFLSDSYTQSPITHVTNGTYNGFDLSRNTNERIDYVFVTKHFIPTRYGILTDIYWTINSEDASKSTPRLPSDHYPVVVGVKYVVE